MLSRGTRRRALLGSLAALVVTAACAPAPVTSPPVKRPVTTTVATTPTVSPTPVTVVAAGDIACSAADAHFLGGLGDATHCQMKATAARAATLKPAVVLPLGDEQYEAATLPEFEGSYAKSWGRFNAIAHPVPGNHEYVTAGAAGYLAYFGASAAPAGKTWYSFNVGSWHVIALDANCNQVGGCGAHSPQGTWLAADLARSTATCTLAIWHQPTFSSSSAGGVANTLPLWQTVVNGGADLVLNGHRHQYERFAQMNAAGAPSSATGAREIVVGTGGEDLEPFGVALPTSQARSPSFGVLDLQLGQGTYTFRFVGLNGTILDQGTGTCH